MIRPSGRVQAASTPAQVVEVHGLGEQQVRVRVEAAGELDAVVVEVALHLEPLPHLEAAVQPLDRLPAELAGEHIVAAEGDLRDLPGERQPGVGPIARRRVVVVAVAPLGVEGDGPPTGAPPGDLLRAGGRARGDGGQRADPLGEHDGPLERLHATHRTADHRMPPGDAQGVGQRGPACGPCRGSDTTGKSGP